MYKQFADEAKAEGIDTSDFQSITEKTLTDKIGKYTKGIQDCLTSNIIKEVDKSSLKLSEQAKILRNQTESCTDITCILEVSIII